MKISDFDTDLLLALMELHGASTTKLAHILFKPIDDYELRKQDSKVRYRLERMVKQELLKKNGAKYVVNVERVFLTDSAMHLGIGVDVPMGLMLVAYPKDGPLWMRQITLEKRRQISENAL